MGQLDYTTFHEALFPASLTDGSKDVQVLSLEKHLRYQPMYETDLSQAPLVVFDFETTGLDTENDYLIEIGALKTRGGEVLEEFSYLIKPPVPITEAITQITGITQDDLENQPPVEKVLPEFLSFIEGGILVAHNASFDRAFLGTVCRRVGIQIEWPVFCTLRMARQLLPDLESRSLDTLAEHYGLTFESRHRSIGDCKVTSAVLQGMLRQEGNKLATWRDVQAFSIK